MDGQAAATKKGVRPTFRAPKKRPVGRIVFALVVVAAVAVVAWTRLRA